LEQVLLQEILIGGNMFDISLSNLQPVSESGRKIMKKYPLLVLISLFFLLAPASHAKAPHELGGLVLGENISAHQDLVIPGTAMAVYEKGLCEEVQIKPPKGFKNGSVQYGVCADHGRIVRIEFKYADGSKKFFDSLLNNCKKKFGAPNEYKGDSFQVFIAWKWIFFDENNNRITLKIQHNTRDEEQRLGNVIKMTMTNLVDEERACWRKKYKPESKGPGSSKEAPDWSTLLPR
jgi:hypothetical protein